jgi:uncharacterized membrane protein
LTKVALTAGKEPPPFYRRYATIWFALGWPAFIGILAIFYLMIAKPQFYAIMPSGIDFGSAVLFQSA